MDEEVTQAPAENIEAVEDNSQEVSPTTETNTSVEATETEGEELEAQTEETEIEAERKPTRAERRIRQLNDQVKQLSNQPNQLIPNFQQPPQLDIQPGQEIAPEDYQQHVAQTAQSVVNTQLDQLRGEFETKEALRNFDSDLAVIEAKYPELSEESPIAPVLEKQIEAEYKQQAYRLVGFDPYTGQAQYRIDPSVRLADIAAAKVADARAIAEQTSAQMKNTIVNQADNTALRPGATRDSEKSVADMSIKEIEDKYGVVYQ